MKHFVGWPLFVSGDNVCRPVGWILVEFANLGSLKCHFLHFDIISEVGCIFIQY